MKKGFSLIEALLAIAAFSIFVTGLIGIFVYGRQGSVVSLNHNKAEMLSREGLAAVRSIGERNFASLTPGTYGLAVSGGVWTLTGSPDTTEGYTRSVVITSPEANVRQAAVNITWQQTPQRSGNLSLSTWVSNWRGAVTVAASWTTPVQEASINPSGNQDGLKVAGSGNYVYLVRAGGNPDFIVVDVTNPAAPVQVGSLNLPGSTINIAVFGSFAYVVTDDNAAELTVIDISNPAAPSHVGSLDLAGNTNAAGVAVSGATVYVTRLSSGNNEFNIINVTVPTLPVLLGSLDLAASGFEVEVSGSFAYVASSHDSQELQVINISNPALPSLAGSYNASGNDDALTVSLLGTSAVIGRDNGDITFLNVSTPASPALQGNYNHGASVSDLSPDSTHNYIFAATSQTTAELAVINATSPAAPTLLSSLNLAGNLNGIFYSSGNDRAYGASTEDAAELIIFRPGP